MVVRAEEIEANVERRIPLHDPVFVIDVNVNAIDATGFDVAATPASRSAQPTTIVNIRCSA
jgi:hypothetical protein